MGTSSARRQAGNVSSWLLPLLASGLSAWPLLSAPSAATITCWCGVTCIAAWLGWRSRSRTDAAGAADPIDTQAAAPAADDPLRELVVQVLPVWEHHLGSVRSQTEHAINELAASFGSLSRQFDDAGFVGADADSGGQATFSLLTLCERQLRPVVTTMNRMLDSKSALVRSVNELALATRELQGMARDVGKIASHTNILAINAAVEAAHAGDAGRGFAVIANEIRKLSQTSAQTGRKIAERMGQVEKITVTTVQAASEASEHDREAIELSGSVVQDVLEHVRELGRNAERMRTQGLVIRQDTENLLVNLQFQDRMSQILSALDQDMRRMHESARDRTALPDPQAWLADLSTTYTMDDQRVAGKSMPVTAAKSEEIEFF